MLLLLLLLLPPFLATTGLVCALTATENATHIVLSNARFYSRVDKSIGAVDALRLDGHDLLGLRTGSNGLGPYLDCYCVPSGFWTPGSSPLARYDLFSGTETTGVDYGGIRMADTYAATGQKLETYWFLRDNETGLHMFSRLVYVNDTTPFLRNLQEFRTLFRPESKMWTHLLTNDHHHAPLPSSEARARQVVVQDATWYLGDTPNDPYVQQMASYFTKYTFQDTWRKHTAHGLFADGSQTADNSTFGAWLVMNTRETYFNGPLHSDLTVDGIVYDYIVSNHHGDQTPNITSGFDRTFGPQFYYFNHHPAGTDLLTSHADAAKLADPEWNVAFYDSIAKHVPSYVTSDKRGRVEVQVKLPAKAKQAIAVLAANGVDFQDNSVDIKAYQYWAEIDSATGRASIPRVKADTYRLTIYADGVFGQLVRDDVVVSAGSGATSISASWEEESEGTELFRIGEPNKSSGEYRHGLAPDPTHPLQPEEYRVYWATHDFVADFPHGVSFKVGESDVGRDLNYVHWSVFGGTANQLRPEAQAHAAINNWTIRFDLSAAQLAGRERATLTVQLAAAKTAAGNTDLFNASEPHSDLRYAVSVNGADLEPWLIPHHQSSSCAVRSAVTCYNLAHKFRFAAAAHLRAGENSVVLSLPFNATGYETAFLPPSVYVQYDALRLEVA